MRRPSPELALLGAAVVLAVALRVVDPLRSPVLAAEDPTIHLFRAERLALKGLWPPDYPPGFPALLVAMQSLGLELYDVARFAPALWGGVAALAAGGLARKLGGAWAGVGAAWLGATIPELVRRGDFLAPTAFDLALLPVLTWLLVEALDGRREAALLLVPGAAWMYAAHPWGLAILALGLAPFLLWRARASLAGRHASRGAWAALAGAGAVALPVLLFVRVPEAGQQALGSVLLGRAGALLGSLGHYALPWMVDPLAMLGAPALLLGGPGALRGPRPLRVLGAGWVLSLLPLLLLDVTGVRYVPMRVAAYLAPGLALLGGAGAAWLVAQADVLRWGRARRSALVACGLAGLLLLAGTGAGAKGWYRIWPASDQEAFQAGARYAQEHHLRVVTASWQATVQMGAWGADVRGEPRLFQNASYRHRLAAHEMHGQPFLVVVDKVALLRADASRPDFQGYDLGFLANSTSVVAGKYARAYVYVDAPYGPFPLNRP